MTLSESRAGVFDEIYATDLVYEPACYKLCGDAHCCHFRRYRTDGGRDHELPLLPGEYEYLQRRGGLEHFEGLSFKTLEVKLDLGVLRYERLAFKLGERSCGCEHGVRPTTCRLYPVLPRFSPTVGLIGIDMNYGLLEELEQVVQAERACRLQGLSFEQMNRFLKVAGAIARDPVCMFYVMAFERTKAHVVANIKTRGLLSKPEAIATGGVASAYKQARMALLGRRAIDSAVLLGELNELAAEFRNQHGMAFDLS